MASAILRTIHIWTDRLCNLFQRPYFMTLDQLLDFPAYAATSLLGIDTSGVSATAWRWVSTPVDPERGMAVFAVAVALAVAVRQLRGGGKQRRAG
jgi:hypothetical protein